MGVGFTKEQQSVIDERGSNVLVSAAAGSGKTTVLVERIIQKITEDNGTSIDRLLVVTFTKAAAASMKEKVLNAIQKKLLEEPENEHLQKQETLVHSAQITTIDSFCQYIIRNNFNEIGLDPAYRVLDEGEKKLIMQDVLEELLEEKYAQKDEAFIECMNYFATGSDDSAVEGFILQLYDYSMSMPWPERWLKERSRDYRVDEDNFEQQEFVRKSKESIAHSLIECRDKMELAVSVCDEGDGPHMYGKQLENELDVFQGIIDKLGIESESGFVADSVSFDELRSMILNIDFKRLSVKKDDSVNTDKREYVKALRTEVRDKNIKQIKDKFFSEDKKTIIKHMDMAAGPVEELCNLALLFKEKFDAKKREKGVIDFGDMEHMALDILVKQDPETGEMLPTAAAQTYWEYYDEVMIDEYQDSNHVQEFLLKAVSGEEIGNYNRFMVGDVKQSIYKFRLARPEIFMEKMQRYKWDEGEKERKIALHNNFRSRNRVLDSVNYIFEQIMGKDLGGVSYDEDAFLRTGASYPETPADMADAFDTEFLFADTGDEKSKDARVTEARLIAARINELRKSGIVTDNNEFRPVKYSDIVILLRAQSGWDSVFKKELEDRGIPVYVESRTGYFSAVEVVTILNLLRILDNPLWDVPMVSVMHSAIGGFSDEELAIIKACDKKVEKRIYDGGSFYEILFRSRLAEDHPDLSQKVSDFIDMIDDFRDKAVYLPVNELIRYILDSTGYKEYCAALPGGEKRLANIDMLIEKAADFEKTSYRGVFHFVRYIEELAKYEVDYGEANTLDENADVVRIMSIHKSKGLEFPVVFLAGMAKNFNFMDTSKPLCLDMDLGIGTYGFDVKNRVKYVTLRKSTMEDCMKNDIIAEEMRILYVAMTRAKEKLIMTGQVSFSEGEKRKASDFRVILQNLSKLSGRKEVKGIQPFLLPFYRRKRATSYQDLVLLGLARHPAFAKLCNEVCPGETHISLDDMDTEDAGYSPKKVPFILRVVSDDELVAGELKKEISHEIRLSKLTSPAAEDIGSYTEFFNERFNFKYAFENYNKLFVKTTVTELKKEKLHEASEGTRELIEEDKKIVPAFIGNKEELKGAARGTVYHKIMELLYEDGSESPEKKIQNISGWLESLVTNKRIEAGDIDCINPADIIRFYNSSAGQRMKDAFYKKRLYRESPFMMGLEASRIDKELPEGELVLIQGIIDVWFEEDDGLVLLDYKTDKVKEGYELVKRYALQLDYYQEALEKITGKKVKERIIYSFTLGEVINL